MATLNETTDPRADPLAALYATFSAWQRLTPAERIAFAQMQAALRVGCAYMPDAERIAMTDAYLAGGAPGESGNQTTAWDGKPPGTAAEQDGYHWCREGGALAPERWIASKQGWHHIFDPRGVLPPEKVKHWKYLGPCIPPDEALP